MYKSEMDLIRRAVKMAINTIEKSPDFKRYISHGGAAPLDADYEELVNLDAKLNNPELKKYGDYVLYLP